MVIYNSKLWDENCSNAGDHGYELLYITPKSVHINEWGCSIQQVRTGKKPHGGNSQTDIAVSLICQGESQKTSSHVQLWAIFDVKGDTYLTTSDTKDIATSLHKKCRRSNQLSR